MPASFWSETTHSPATSSIAGWRWRGAISPISPNRHPRNQNGLWFGLYREHRHHIGLLGDEISRVGTNRLLDLFSPAGRDAFVLQDKRLTRRGDR
jgi:hypothetical protein